MNCPYCKNRIPDESVFCMFCGERTARRRREKKTASYPKYRVLADGSLLGQLMVDGQRETIKAANEREYKAKIDALRAGIADLKAHPEKRTLKTLLREYIDKNDAVLSPATIRGYEGIHDNRFPEYRDLPFGKIDCQRMINDEAKDVSPKTLKNAWGLVSAALRDAGIPVPDVNLPAVPDTEADFLDYDQITKFLEAVKGDDCEAAALLMLHSLRMSEVLKLAAEDIHDNQICVRGAVVPGKDHKLVEKASNKSRASSRAVPVMIPRLLQVLPEEGRIVKLHPSSIRRRIENVCIKAGLPVCSPHDLRRSFASLAYHLQWSERAIMAVGGWSNMATVHKIYVKLSQNDIQSDVNKMRNYYGFTT